METRFFLTRRQQLSLFLINNSRRRVYTTGYEIHVAACDANLIRECQTGRSSSAATTHKTDDPKFTNVCATGWLTCIINVCPLHMWGMCTYRFPTMSLFFSRKPKWSKRANVECYTRNAHTFSKNDYFFIILIFISLHTK